MSDIGYLGPEGTFTQVACESYLSDTSLEFRKQAFSSLASLFDGLLTVQVPRVFIPIENSLGGEVVSTLDGLIGLPDSFFISAEYSLEISQTLLAKEELALAEIKTIYSHEQSFSQCRGFLKTNCPEAETIVCSSNAVAAQKAAEGDSKVACIGPAKLFEIYQLKVLAESINDSSENRTRFVVISSQKTVSSGKDKTSFVFSAQKDRPGSLASVLSELSSRGINLTRITSRPSRKALGDYVFFVDCEGHSEDDGLKECLEVIQEKSSYFRLLGSYARSH